jgi:hypothetical protein
MVGYWQRGNLVGGRSWRWLVTLVGRWSFRFQPIDVCERRFQYQPRRFRSRGTLYTVRQIERVWELGAGGQSPRRYFRVCCDHDRSFTIFQDLRVGCWYAAQ